LFQRVVGIFGVDVVIVVGDDCGESVINDLATVCRFQQERLYDKFQSFFPGVLQQTQQHRHQEQLQQRQQQQERQVVRGVW
jgi:hypothetical protein